MARECEQCGSRKFRKDAATGMAICEDGHVVQGFRSEALVQEMTQHALQKRNLKKGPRRNKRKERGDRNLEYYHGADADFLRHQAFQIMLRTQVHAIQRLWQVPAALEAIARDLWAIQLVSHPLSTLPNSKNRAESPFEAMANLSVNSPTGSRKGSRRGSPAGSGSSSSGFDTDSDVQIREDVIDPELLEQVSATEGSDDEGDGEGKTEQGERKPKKRLAIRAVDTVATLVVALWILRIPVMNVDIQCLIEHCEIPYIDFGHTDYLPSTLKTHLNRDSMRALSPSQAPRPIYLFNACIRLARVATHTYDLTIPECNACPIVWRCVSSLGGTPFTYRQTTRLLAHLDINLSMTVPIKVIGRKTPIEKEEDDEYEHDRALPVVYRDLMLPELSVVCALIMIVKIRYGIDGVPRVDTDNGLPLPPVGMWMQGLKSHLDEGTFTARSTLLDEIDLINMPGEDIDALLDQCEDVLLGRHDVGDDPMFPLPPRSKNGKTQATPSHPDWSALHEQRQEDEAEAKVRAGRNYRSYDAKDYLGTLPHDLDCLVRAAAQVIGVTTQDILERLQVMERRLQQRRRTLTRRGSQTCM